MKILLVYPNKRDFNWYAPGLGSAISLTLPYLAALTPPEIDVTIVETKHDELDYDTHVDLVGLTALTAHSESAYQVADRFRRRGKTVVIGGVHASFFPKEAIQHCDAVVVGEAEEVWRDLLIDFQNNELKKFYKSDKPHNLKTLPMPRFDLVKLKPFMRLPIQTARGCVHHCDYCSVPEMYGGVYRLRPVDEVIREIEEEISQFGKRKIFFVDDIINGNKKRTLELFRALIPLKIKWGGQSTLYIADSPELLDAAVKSGCSDLSIGVESINSQTLRGVNKGFNKVERLAQQIGRIRECGINVFANVIFGFDNDDETVFKNTVDSLVRSKVPFMAPFILTPVPGTKIYKNYQQERRLLDKEPRTAANGFNVMFIPKNMTPTALQSGFWMALNRFYNIRSILERLLFPPSGHLLFCLFFNILICLGTRKVVFKRIFLRYLSSASNRMWT